MSPDERTIYGIIYKRAVNRRGTPTLGVLAERSGLREDIAQKILNKLNDSGMISIENFANGRIRTITISTINGPRSTHPPRGRVEASSVFDFGGGPIACLPANLRQGFIDKIFTREMTEPEAQAAAKRLLG